MRCLLLRSVRPDRRPSPAGWTLASGHSGTDSGRRADHRARSHGSSWADSHWGLCLSTGARMLKHGLGKVCGMCSGRTESAPRRRRRLGRPAWCLCTSCESWVAAGGLAVAHFCVRVGGCQRAGWSPGYWVCACVPQRCLSCGIWVLGLLCCGLVCGRVCGCMWGCLLFVIQGSRWPTTTVAEFVRELAVSACLRAHVRWYLSLSFFVLVLSTCQYSGWSASLSGQRISKL